MNKIDFVGHIEISVEGDTVKVSFHTIDGSRMIDFAPQSLTALRDGCATLRLGPVKMTATLELT